MFSDYLQSVFNRKKIELCNNGSQIFFENGIAFRGFENSANGIFGEKVLYVISQSSWVALPIPD